MDENAARRNATLRTALLGRHDLFDVQDLEVRYRQREVDLVLTVRVDGNGSAERWEVTLGTDKQLYWSPPPDQLDELVFLVQVHLDEWWCTKDREAGARRMGRRID